MADCRLKFDQYDDNKNGTIEKEELRNLLKDTLGKKMSPVMINRFVDSQFQLWDKDDSGTIEFEEFIHMYAKMYANPDGPSVGFPLAPPGGRPPIGFGGPKK